MIDLFKRFFSAAAEDGRNPASQDNERDVTVAMAPCSWRWGASMRPSRNRKWRR